MRKRRGRRSKRRIKITGVKSRIKMRRKKKVW
jgi:hypothetical protein